jgi:hypothetical protein
MYSNYKKFSKNIKLTNGYNNYDSLISISSYNDKESHLDVNNLYLDKNRNFIANNTSLYNKSNIITPPRVQVTNTSTRYYIPKVTQPQIKR